MTSNPPTSSTSTTNNIPTNSILNSVPPPPSPSPISVPVIPVSSNTTASTATNATPVIAPTIQHKNSTINDKTSISGANGHIANNITKKDNLSEQNIESSSNVIPTIIHTATPTSQEQEPQTIEAPLIRLEKKARKILEEELMNEILEEVVGDLCTKLATRTYQEFKKQYVKEQEQLELQAKIEEETRMLEQQAALKEKKQQQRKEKREVNKKQQIDFIAEEVVEDLITEECESLVNNLLIQEKDTILGLLSNLPPSPSPSTPINNNLTTTSPISTTANVSPPRGTIPPSTTTYVQAPTSYGGYSMNVTSPTKGAGYRITNIPPQQIAPIPYPNPVYTAVPRNYRYATPAPTAYIPAYAPVHTYYYPTTMVPIPTATPLVYSPNTIVPTATNILPTSPSIIQDNKPQVTNTTHAPISSNNNTAPSSPSVAINNNIITASAATIRTSPESIGFKRSHTVVLSNLPEQVKKGDITTLFSDSTIALNPDYTTKVTSN